MFLLGQCSLYATTPLGDIQYIGKERIQTDGSRLDLLFEDEKEETRFTVELQLGELDYSHIFRMINYWNNERKKTSKKCFAVIVAEKIIDSRWFNLLTLFDTKKIQIKAIQLNASQIEGENAMVLNFIKVMDTKEPEIEDEKKEEITDRNYWETKRSTPERLALVYKMEKILKELYPDIERLNYNKSYIGLIRNKKATNFIHFKPLKKFFNILIIKENITTKTLELIENSGLISEDIPGWKHYKVTIPKKLSDEQTEALKTLFKEAGTEPRDDEYGEWTPAKISLLKSS